MSAIVLDASVAAKWVLPGNTETLVEESLNVLGSYARGRIRILVPDLFWAEMGNLLWKAVRRKRISTAYAEEALLALTEHNFPTSPSKPLMKSALGIAFAFDRTVYDSLYVALAVASGRILLTADERLANSLAAHFQIRWLGSF